MGEESWPAFGTSEEKQYQFKPIKGKSLRFKAKAAHDCHLAFTSTPEDNDDMFEVFLGGWEGAKSAIRFKKTEDIAKEDTPDILNNDEVREFWITWDDDVVKVGRGGEWEPFLSVALPEQIVVNYFGFSTGWGAIGWWQFYCEKVRTTEDCLAYNYEPVYGTSLTFSVNCANDAHISLTSGPEDTPLMYEVFIGGWANQKSAIRLNKDKAKTVAKVDTSDFVCQDDERTFWITFNAGHIRVGQFGSLDPFMEYITADPWKITAFPREPRHCLFLGVTRRLNNLLA